MIWLINYEDALGSLLLQSIRSLDMSYVAMHTIDMPKHCALGQDAGQEVMWWQGARYALDDITLAYSGYSQIAPHQTITLSKQQDWYYVNSAWQAWLRYSLARIPRTIGVLPDARWIETWRHLPCLAKMAPVYGLQAPSYRVVRGSSYGNNYAYLTQYIVEDIASFADYCEESVLAVEIPDGVWVQCAWLGSQLYALAQGEPCTLPTVVESGLDALSTEWGLTSCQHLLRHTGSQYILYGCSPRVTTAITSTFSQAIIQFLKAEYLAACY